MAAMRVSDPNPAPVTNGLQGEPRDNQDERSGTIGVRLVSILAVVTRCLAAGTTRFECRIHPSGFCSETGPKRALIQSGRSRSLGTLEDSDLRGRVASGRVHRTLRHRLRDERGDLRRVPWSFLEEAAAEHADRRSHRLDLERT
jgi:hypothetical protein